MVSISRESFSSNVVYAFGSAKDWKFLQLSVTWEDPWVLIQVLAGMKGIDRGDGGGSGSGSLMGSGFVELPVSLLLLLFSLTFTDSSVQASPELCSHTKQ